MTSALRPGALALLLLAAAAPAAAHPLAPSLLEIRELGPAGGRAEVLFRTPLRRPAGAALAPRLPARCRGLGEPRWRVEDGALAGRWRVDCGGAGLVGAAVGVEGLARSRTDALVRIELADGRRMRALLRPGAADFVVPAREARGRVARGYLALGGEHILGGLDHLLFLAGLVLLVRGRRALLLTVSAFTAGHSATLVLAGLGIVPLGSALAEVAIAASVLALAGELARGADRPGPMARAPVALAFAFGLVHGLGFAGALAEAGLPAGEIPLALLAFNLGIELGQLGFVAGLLAARWALRPLAARGPGWLRRAPAYAIGSAAALFLFERSALLLGRL